MSRTYAHMPSWVKERDPSWRAYYKEDHNHSWHVVGHEKVVTEDGHMVWKAIWKKVERCDLDVYLASTGWVRTACSIRLVSSGRNVDCGCNMCTDQLGRRASRRFDRHEAKRLLRSGRWEEINPSIRWRY